MNNIFFYIYKVVWLVCLSMTTLQQLPLVFLRLSESQESEYDLQIVLNPYVPGNAINFTKLTELTSSYNSLLKNLMSPRLITLASAFSARHCVWSSDPLIDQNWYTEHLKNPREQAKDWMWMYHGEFQNATCNRRFTKCVPQYCKTQVVANQFYFNTVKEKEMDYGRNWNLTKPKL